MTRSDVNNSADEEARILPGWDFECKKFDGGYREADRNGESKIHFWTADGATSEQPHRMKKRNTLREISELHML